MTPTTSQECLATLAEIRDAAPELRLGQILAHLSFLCEDQLGQSIWEVEDERLLLVLRRHEVELAARQTHAISQ